MTTLFVAFIIVVSITIVYLLIKNKHLSDGLLDHKLYIQKMHAELFPKETNFLFGDLLGEQKERNRIEEIEKRLNDAIDAGDKNRKELEKYLGITYVKTEYKTEGYEKINLTVCSGSGVTYSNCGSYTDVSYEKPKKVAKKSKKK